MTTTDPAYTISGVPLASPDAQQILFDFTRVGLNITKIEKVDNPYLENLFTNEKRVFEDADRSPNLQHLYHSTRGDLDAVLSEGLDFRLGNSGIFGKGVYFAQDPRKAAAYGVFNSINGRGRTQRGNERTMLRVAVLLGDCARVIPGNYVRPPAKEKEKRAGPTDPPLFDSIMGQAAPRSHYEFIVFDNKRYYITHVLTYGGGAFWGSKKGKGKMGVNAPILGPPPHVSLIESQKRGRGGLGAAVPIPQPFAPMPMAMAAPAMPMMMPYNIGNMDEEESGSELESGDDFDHDFSIGTGTGRARKRHRGIDTDTDARPRPTSPTVEEMMKPLIEQGIANFKSFTSATDEDAQRILKLTDGDVQRALDVFYEEKEKEKEKSKAETEDQDLSKSEKIKQFCSIVGTTGEQGSTYIEQTKGDVQAAVNLWFNVIIANSQSGAFGDDGGENEIESEGDHEVEDDNVDAFVKATGATMDVAKGFLDREANDLRRAINSFLDS